MDRDIWLSLFTPHPTKLSPLILKPSMVASHSVHEHSPIHMQHVKVILRSVHNISTWEFISDTLPSQRLVITLCTHILTYKKSLGDTI